MTSFKLLMLGFLFCLIGLQVKAAAIIIDPNNGTASVHVAYSQSTAGLQLSYTAAGNGTFTLTMPAGVTYIPGSMTFTSSAGAVIAESNISNLAAPVFSITGATVGANSVITYGIRANCATQGSASIGVSVTVGDTDTGSISISILKAALTIDAHDAAVNYVRGGSGSSTSMLTNGGNGSLDSLIYFFKQNGPLITDSIKANGHLATYIGAVSDTLFYQLRGVHFPGGTFDNGESITITRYFHVPVCYNGGTAFPNFQSTYLANFGRNGSRCQSPTPGDFGQYNYNSAGSGDPTAAVSQVSVIRSATPCQTALVRYRFTGGYTGNIAFGKGYDVSFAFRGVGGNFWPPTGYKIKSAKLVSNNASIPFTFSTSGTNISLANSTAVQGTDPDGAGGGLEDMDGDGYYDDINPALTNRTFDIEVEWEYQKGVPCANNPAAENISMYGLVKNQCGQDITSSQATIIAGSLRATGAILMIASPFELGAGQTGTTQTQISRTAPSIQYLSCPTNQFSIRFPVAPGMTVTAIRAGATNLTFSVVSDTAVALLPSGTTNPFICDVDYTITPGVTPSGVTPTIILAYECNSTCPNSREDVSCLTGPPILIVAPGPCPAGGGNASNSIIKRTTTGFTNYTGTAYVPLASIPLSSLKRGLPCDSVEITSKGGIAAGNVITGGEPYYYEVSYNLHGTVNRLFQWHGGTYTYQSTTAPLPAPVYEANYNGKHYVIYYLGAYPAGAMIDISLKGTMLDAPTLTNTLEGVSGFYNGFFNLDDGFSNPSPNGGDTRYFGCAGQALEFYVRNPRGAFNLNLAYTGGGTCNQFMNEGRNWYLRGTNGAGTEIDYFPGEVRPIDILDSIVVNLPGGWSYNSAGGAPFLRVRGNPNEGGFPSNATQTMTTLGAPTIQGNRLVWKNPGNWWIPDDALQGGYQFGFPAITDCTANGFTCGFSVGTGNMINYYGHTNANSRNPTCPPSFARLSPSTTTFSGRPVHTLTNLSGTQNADQRVECFNIKLNVSCATSFNTYIYFPGGGPSGTFNITSVKNTTTNAVYPVLQAAGGQWAQLGNVGGDLFLTVCSEYSNCANPDIPYRISWGCSSYPADPAISGCSTLSGTFDLSPAPSGLQAQFIAQPTNPVSLCDPLVYDFNMLSTLAADLVDPRLEVTIPTGMSINTVQIEYPYNSGNFETVTPSGTTGTVTIPYGLHSMVNDSLPGVNFQTMPNPRTARMRLTFLTDCSFTSGDRILVKALGEEPCGAPAQGNNTQVYSDPVQVAGITQNYISIVNNLNVGPDTIITCSNRTVSMDMVLLNTTSNPVTLDPMLDSLKITFPAGIQYVPGSYNCSTSPNCYGTPIINPITGNLTFPVPAGITVPAAGSITINFSLDINALVNEGCGVPGGLTISMIRSYAGIACASQSGGVCPNPVQFITGSITKQLSAKKANISTITARVCRSSTNTYDFNGTFAISQGVVPAMQSVVVEVFCLSGGNPVGAPVATQTVNGLLNMASGNIPFSGSFMTACAGEQFQIRISPVTNGGTDQCVCSAVSTNVSLSNPTFIVTAGSSCAGSLNVNLPLNSITNGGNQYTVNFDDPAITDVTTATNIPSGGILNLAIPSNLATGMYTGTVTVINSATGCSGDAPLTFTVHGLPTVNTPIIFCVGTTAMVTGSGTPAAVNPYVSSNPAIATVTSAGVITGLVAGTVNITYTDINGCQAVSAVTVNPLPTITGTATVCVNAMTTLTGSGTPDAMNPWVSSNPAVATVNSSGVVTGVSAGTSTLTYTNSNGCTTTILVTVYPLPTLNGGTICTGSNLQVTGSGIPAISNPYVSSNPAVATVNNIGLVTGISPGTVTITYTNINGCQATSTVTITVSSITITALNFINQSSCNDNGTPSLYSDDYFTADVVVTFSNPPVTGDLVISGDLVMGGGPTSVPVATAGAGPTYTFTNIRFKADNTATVLSAEFTDDLGCSFTVTSGPIVQSCVTPGVALVEACKCFDVFYGLPEFDPLEFSDSIKVTSNPGETWHFVSHTGLEVPNPTINIPLPQNAVIPEVMPGMYGILVNHSSGEGYSGVITNGTVTLNVGNLCTNPSLTLPNLAGGSMCQSSPVFSFSEITATLSGMNAPGTFTFNIVRAPGDTLFNVTELNPALMPNNSTIKVMGRYVPNNPMLCPHNFSYSIQIADAACPCVLEVNAAVPGICDPNTNTYDLSVSISYQHVPVGDNIVITTGNGETVTIVPTYTTGSEVIVLSGLSTFGTSNVSVSAAMQFFGTCNTTLTNAYNAPTSCLEPPCTGSPDAISGNVFNDSNNDGSSTSELGQAGVQVQVFDCLGNLVGTTTSDASGNWNVSGLTNGQQYTVVFGIPPAMSSWGSGAQGANNHGEVQIAIPQQCDLDYGIVNQENYCQTNPLLAVSRQYLGTQNFAGTGMLGIYKDEPESLSPTTASLADNMNIGTTYGVAYQRSRHVLYTSAMVRHYFDYGPGGFDAIYPLNISDPNGDLAPAATSTPGTTIKLSTLGVNMGADPRTAPITGSAPFNDGNVYQKVGKAGIGDIEMSTTGDTLFVVNLNAAAPSLVLLNVSNPASVSLIAEIPLPTTGCTGGNFAPWGLKTYKGKVYVGGICTAETSQNIADLDAFVYRWDGGSTFTQIVTMGMNYATGPAAYRSDDTYIPSNWRAWTNTWNPDELPLASGNLASQPQPILQDIEFDADGSLILGFGDRFSYQAASGNRRYDQTSGTEVFTPIPAGDIIRFCNVSGTLVQEGSASSCVQPSIDYGSTQLPGYYTSISEYYSDGYVNEFNDEAGFSETALGGLARVPGSSYLLTVNHDPIRNQGPLFSSGVRTLNPNGRYNKAWLLVDDGYAGDNRSGGNLGDIEPLCNTIPIEIGDYVWIDTNNDGKQSACEAPLPGVSVELYKKDGTLIGQATTDATGRYLFNEMNVDTIAPYGSGGFTGMSPNTAYYIVVGKNLSQFNTGTNQLTIGSVEYELTTANTGLVAAPDHTDSDGSLASGLLGGAAALNGYPAYCAITPMAGSDHSFDFGFVPPCNITAISFSAPACNDNGTPNNTSDDWFASNITVTFNSPPPTGTLDLSGDVLTGGGALSTPVATVGQGPTYTFTGIRLKADGTASVVTVSFSADPLCTFTESNGPNVAPCSVPVCMGTPSASLVGVPADCNSALMPNNNGRIVLLSQSNVDRVGFSTGASYTGPGYTAALPVGALPADIVTAIPNTPAATYTIRVFNGGDFCFTDYTVTVNAGATCPTDPMGYIYCEANGQIIAGGSITVSGPGSVLITKNGSTGEYQFFTDGTAGTYTMTYTPPAGYALSTIHLPLASIDPTGQPNPYQVGAGSSNGVSLDNFTPAANPYTFSFVLAPGDPEIQLNNIPLSGCCVTPNLAVIAGANTTVCRGGSINLATLVTSSGGGTLSYYNTLSDAQNGVNAIASGTVTVSAAQHFYIRSQTAPGCYAIKQVTVTLKPDSCGTINVNGPN